jgi:hypothetical protein
MEAAKDRMQLVEKIFDQALKEKLSKLARTYDPDLVSQLWTQIAKNGEGKEYFSRWKRKPEMTVAETMSSLDDHLNWLQELLQKRQTQNVGQIRK